MLQCPRSPGFGAAVKPLSSLVPSPSWVAKIRRLFR